MTVIPGQGIDFAALGHVLLLVLCLYVAASVVDVGAGVRAERRGAAHRPAAALATSRTSCTGCRCSYFDTQPRGELLSRVTNDIDNIQQTMQQTMSQLLTSLLTWSAC